MLELIFEDEPLARTVSYVPSCGDGWAELQNVTVEDPTDEERSDTLRLRIVRCETDDCDLYGEGFGTPPAVITETTMKISVVLE